MSKTRVHSNEYTQKRHLIVLNIEVNIKVIFKGVFLPCKQTNKHNVLCEENENEIAIKTKDCAQNNNFHS